MQSSIIPSSRNLLTYLEYCTINVVDGNVCFNKSDSGVQKTFSIPHKNINILSLGTGTSISHEAIKLLSKSDVMVCFHGQDFSNFYMAQFNRKSDPFIFREWINITATKELRLSLARKLLTLRFSNIKTLEIPIKNIQNLSTNEEILAFEAEFMKKHYQKLAQDFSISFRRDYHSEDLVNTYLNIGHSLSYQVAATALWILGISPNFPVIHGQTVANALIYDLADVFKAPIIDHLAFELSISEKNTYKARRIFINKLIDSDTLSLSIKTMLSLIRKKE